MPPEFLLHMLNSSRIPMQEKRIFVELMQELYVNHYSLELAHQNLMPEILLWRKADSEKSIDQLFQEEKHKLFTLYVFEDAEVDQDILQNVESAEDQVANEGEIRAPGGTVTLTAAP